MKLRKFVCLMAACCLLAGCGKKNNDTSTISDTSGTDTSGTDTSGTDISATDAMTTTNADFENTEIVTQNMDIPEDAVLKITETTYRNGEVWETRFIYRNTYDDVVACAYVSSIDGSEVLDNINEYEYDENGKKIYEKSISASGDYTEIEYLSDNTEKGKGYDENGRLEVESKATYDEYGNSLMSKTIVYDEDGGVLGIIAENFDYDYDENGKILVCRECHETGEIISTTTNTYDDNGNLLSSEKVYADYEKYGLYSEFHSYSYDNKDNLISEEVIVKWFDADTINVTESSEWQYDESDRKIRWDYSLRRIGDDYDVTESEYTIYEYTQL